MSHNATHMTDAWKTGNDQCTLCYCSIRDLDPWQLSHEPCPAIGGVNAWAEQSSSAEPFRGVKLWR